MSTRTERVERLIQVRSKSLDTARAMRAQSLTALEAARRERDAVEKAWSDAAEAMPTLKGTLVDHELEHQRIHLLRLRADRAAKVLVEREVAAEQARLALLAASQELRKLELWRESIVEAAIREERRAERIQTDEAAARRVRGA